MTTSPASPRHAHLPPSPQPPGPQAPGPGPGAGATGIAIQEKKAPRINGFIGLVLVLALMAGAVVVFARGIIEAGGGDPPAGPVITGIVLFCVSLIALTSLVIVFPGDTRVVTFFGSYIGTVRKHGFSLLPPLTKTKKVSVRVRNFETAELKVNDADGNPVNIAAIVVWQVTDTAKATFAVEDYRNFVEVQAEAALRHVATTHPYDNPSDDAPSLRGSTDLVSAQLAREVADRVQIAGVEVVETRISKLAYAQEIAQAMLQRQQAGAIIAARERIVEGAVTMVESALARLEQDDVVVLDDERRAAMVSNLLVVLCGESRATPIVNTGTLNP